ncbi:msx2-interacting protein [Plakobranchus ocellatus]|uniref:Msx2-interacting protein n=1 Tax=Plakobranchus ocellatus TaxID=259542 RepID=A0AAV4DE90_9GAST|nr:msx2-interacting protein [Plakobranchus ocellatus]
MPVLFVIKKCWPSCNILTHIFYLCVTVRYGKIQSVKLQAAKENGGTGTATVAFNDIKSAAKAHHANNSLGEATLRTDYWEGSTQTPVLVASAPTLGASSGAGSGARGGPPGSSYANPPATRPASGFASWAKG